MSIEQNKQIAERIPMELNKHNVGVFDEVVGPGAVDHSVPPGRFRWRNQKLDGASAANAEMRL